MMRATYIYSIIDIDECEEGNSGCDPLRESCTNLVGGFSCHCLPEYVRVEGECQCELKVSLPELYICAVYSNLPAIVTTSIGSKGLDSTCQP